jgi:hypothetical protein
MRSLHPVDITVIVLYLGGITALGVWMARCVKNISLLIHPGCVGQARFE